MFQVANFLAEGLVLLSALVVTLNAPLHAACNTEDYTSRGVLCTLPSFSWKKKPKKRVHVVDHLCRSASGTISPPLAATPTCEI